jgi:hypothetical protein
LTDEEGTKSVGARFEQGIYILDEPEAALSPQRQVSFLRVIHDRATPRHAQFLIATHSPIILAYPGATLYSLDGDAIQEISYRETTHFLLTRDLLNSPDTFFKHLFSPGDVPPRTETEQTWIRPQMRDIHTRESDACRRLNMWIRRRETSCCC